MRNLKQLGNSVNISIPKDSDGYSGRECPNPECRKYFKITFGTGLKGENPCYCPYCGFSSDHSDFHTSDQIAYAKSVTIRKITDAFDKDLKEMEFEIKPKGPFGIGVSMKVKRGSPHPIYTYGEKELETKIECANCALKYAVYGVFAYCPDCSEHNSLQIFNNSMDVIIKTLEIVKTLDEVIANQMIVNALEDCVSSFDGFGREICHLHSSHSSNPNQAERIRFQNLKGALKSIKKYYGINICDGLENDEWIAAIISFQKRHLFEHKMGVIDEEYIRKTNDRDAILGRKISLDKDEIIELIRILKLISVFLVKKLNENGDASS